jgi:nucleotide-binding universal stress UspA family protein
MAYQHVLVVCDGSSEADEAVRAASEIALRDRARLTVAAVVELERPGRGCQFGASTWNEVLHDAASADLDRARSVVDSPAHFTILAGPPGRALVDGARELGCDAIILPPRPRTRLRRILSRDRALAVRRRTGCDVLQIRE